MAAWWKVILDTAHKYAAHSGAGTLAGDVAIEFLTTTGAQALVITDGKAGQHLFVTMVADGGAGTISSATTNLVTYTTIVFDDVGDWGCFRFNGRAWELIANRGLTLT